MQVSELVAVLERFPADATVAVGDVLMVDGQVVVGDGELLFRVRKGYKGVAGLERTAPPWTPAPRVPSPTTAHENAPEDADPGSDTHNDSPPAA